MGKYVIINGQKVYVDEGTDLKDDAEDADAGDGGADEGAGGAENEGSGAEEGGGTEDGDDVDKIALQIAEKISKEIGRMNKVNSDAKAKKEKLAGVKVVDKIHKIYELKSGKAVTMKESEMSHLSSWFKGFLNKDRDVMKEYIQKLEPLQTGSNADGGYLVPTLLHNAIVDILEDLAVVKPRATIIDMTGMKTNQLNIDSIIGKPQTYWTDELGVKGSSSMTFDQVSLTPYKLASIVTLSTELRDDTPFNIIQIISKAFADSVAKAEDRAFMTANGTGRPTGIDNYTFTTINAGGALRFNHLVSAYWALPQAYRQRAVWIMNGRTIADISNIADTTGQPILKDQGVLTEPGIPVIKGRPVLEQNDVDSDKIFFGDLSAYWIAIKRPMVIDVADQATVGTYNLWQRNMLGVKVEERVDGELTTTRSFVEVSNTGVS